MSPPRCLLPALLLLSVLAGTTRAHRAASIPWAKSYAEALEAAKEAKKPIWIAFWPRLAYAGDPLSASMLRDSRLVTRAEAVVPLRAGYYASGFGRAKRDEKQLHAVWQEIAAPVFGKAEGERLPPPQHVVLDSDGKVLLAAPYELTPGELSWFLREAARRSDGTAPALAEDERAPEGLSIGERLRQGRSPEPQPGEVRRAVETLSEPRDVARRMGQLVPSLAVVDDRRIHRRALDVLDNAHPNHVRAALDALARSGGCADWWLLVENYIDHHDGGLRRRAYWVLRTLRPADAARKLQAQWRDEGRLDLKGRLLRAWVRCDPTGRKQRTLIRQSLDADVNPILRVHATFALADLADRDTAVVLLGQGLYDGDAQVRLAAVVSILLRQERRLFPEIERTIEREKSDEVRKKIELVYRGRERPQRLRLDDVRNDVIGQVEKR